MVIQTTERQNSMPSPKQFDIMIIVSFIMIIVIGLPLAVFDPNLEYPIMILPMLCCAASCIIFGWYRPVENKEKSASELLNKRMD